MNVSTLVFLGLAVVWAIVLLPELLRKLSGVRSSDTIQSFNQQLAVLDRSGRDRSGQRAAHAASNVIDFGSRARAATPARPAATPARVAPASVRRRRQEVLTVLGSAALLTLLCTVAFGGPFLALHLLADVLLIAYVVELARVTQSAPSAGAVRREPVGLRSGSATVRGAVSTSRRVAN